MITANFNLQNKPIGAIFTPLKWAKWLVSELGLVQKWMEGATICDPTAGRGVFVQALLDVSNELGIEVDDDSISRIFLIEKQPAFIGDFHALFRAKYHRTFPPENALCADIITENPGLKFDILIGNPPWANFNDLPNDYKEALKRHFIAHELVKEGQSLLLGSARVDLSALVLTITHKLNLKPRGESAFFVPLSLFLNDGAHACFRNYAINGKSFAPKEIWDFKELDVFPDIMTRFGVARFQRDEAATYPIPYQDRSFKKWVSRLAAPIGKLNAPLSVFDTEEEFDAMSRSMSIEVKEDQKPRQGVNTCGANQVFIFDHAPTNLPPEFVFPLITKECFRHDLPLTPKKYILLSYNVATGQPLDKVSLQAHPLLSFYLQSHQSALLARKGTMLNTWLKRGIWWACLGVGKYNFAPFKIVWEAYGKSSFNPRIFGSHLGMPWQANQAMQAFIPCSDLSEAEDLLHRLRTSNIEKYLQSMNIEGTCNWAQPGRIMRFLNFAPKDG